MLLPALKRLGGHTLVEGQTQNIPMRLGIRSVIARKFSLEKINDFFLPFKGAL